MPQKPRKKIPVDVKQVVLHEAGYRCGNPGCREILTLDMHHMEYYSVGGSDEPANLLPLCGTCHDKVHAGIFPQSSVRAWKMLLIAVNEAFPRASVDVLLTLDRLGEMVVTSDAILSLGGLIVSGLVEVRLSTVLETLPKDYHSEHLIRLSERGALFVAGWKSGDQEKALGIKPKP